MRLNGVISVAQDFHVAIRQVGVSNVLGLHLRVADEFVKLARVFERLGSDAENWQARLQKLTAGPFLGRFFAASRARLREVAGRLGVHHLANLGGCAAP
jgi:hypothetical protein